MRLGPVPPRSSVEVVREAATEVRTSVVLRVRGAFGERRVEASLGRLYATAGRLVRVPILDRPGKLARLETLAVERPRIVVLNHYLERRGLRFDVDTGELEQLSDERPDAWKEPGGQFITVGTAVWGVVSTPTGPWLVHDSERMPLARPDLDLQVEQGETVNRFRLIETGTTRFETDYPRPARAAWGYDNWSAEEESADFFLWLAKAMKNAELVERWTAPWAFAGGQTPRTARRLRELHSASAIAAPHASRATLLVDLGRDVIAYAGRSGGIVAVDLNERRCRWQRHDLAPLVANWWLDRDARICRIDPLSGNPRARLGERAWPSLRGGGQAFLLGEHTLGLVAEQQRGRRTGATRSPATSASRSTTSSRVSGSARSSTSAIGSRRAGRGPAGREARRHARPLE